MTKATINLASIIASTAITGMIAATQHVLEERTKKLDTIRRGYEEVNTSDMATFGLKLGEFCIASNMLHIHILPEDRRGHTEIGCFSIQKEVPYEGDLELGFYIINIEGKLKKAFYDGNSFYTVPADCVKATRKVDLEIVTVVKELKELRTQVARTSELETEIKYLMKKIENLESRKAATSKKSTASKNPTTEKNLAE